jgi:hypothetical protein
MAQLTDLPNEVLELIYYALGSVDDVNHLGRTCKATCHVTHQRSVYLNIMRHVIHDSPQHRYDYQLNRMLVLHHGIVGHITQSRTRLPVTGLPASYRNVHEEGSLHALRLDHDLTDWSDQAICEVLARYQGIFWNPDDRESSIEFTNDVSVRIRT